MHNNVAYQEINCLSSYDVGYQWKIESRTVFGITCEKVSKMFPSVQNIQEIFIYLNVKHTYIHTYIQLG